MNKRQVIILWIIAIILSAAVVVVKSTAKPGAKAATKRAPGQTLFADFPAAEISRIRVEGAAGTVTLDKKDGKWTIAERDGYPANGAYANGFLRALAELKVTRAIEAGPSFAPRFGMNAEAKEAGERGLTAVFSDAAGKELARVSLGKEIAGGQGDAMMGMGGGAVGRFVRNHADESGFYASSEMFPSVSDEIPRWIDTAFVNPEKIKSVSSKEEGEPGIAWKVSRETEEANLKLEGAAPEEVLNTAVSDPLKSALSYSRFEDVLPAAETAAKVDAGKSRTVVIETFEGFKYTLVISPPKQAAEETGNPAPTTENSYVTVAVEAVIAKERKKAKDEKPEDAAAKDAAFAKRSQELGDKLAKEKAFAGRTFEVSKATLGALLKSRAELTAKAEPTPGAGIPGGAQMFPGGAMITPPNMPGGIVPQAMPEGE